MEGVISMSSRIFNELEVIKLIKSTNPKYKNYEYKYELDTTNSVEVETNQLFIGKINNEDGEEILGLFLYIDGDVRSVSFDDTTYDFVKNEIEEVNDLLLNLRFPYGEENNEVKNTKKLSNFLDGDVNA